MAAGESHITGAGDGADVRSTAGIMAALGATVERVADDGRRVDYRVVSPGADGLEEPEVILDCGNSGTSLRLITGMLAGLPMTCILDGDASLRRRPVARIIEPLRSMGAVLHGRHHDSFPPLTVVGHTPLQAVDVTTPVPSAQVKSAILLAGLRAEGRTTVRERVATRDHTERMLRARACRFGAKTGLMVLWPGPYKEGWRCRRSMSASLVTCQRPPSGWSPERSTRTRNSRCGMWVSTRPGARSSIFSRPWAPGSRSGRPQTTMQVGSANRWPISSSTHRSCAGSTWRPPTWRLPSTRSRSCAWPRRRPGERPRSGAPASCATRSRTGSPVSLGACGRWA